MLLDTGLSGSIFTLQMSYDEFKLQPPGFEAMQAAKLSIYLAWLNPYDAGPGIAPWENAVLSNASIGANALAGYQGCWDSFASIFGVTQANRGLYLGSWGVDIATNKVWPIVDHQGQFASVPEPSSLLLAAIAIGGLLLRFVRPTTGFMHSSLPQVRRCE